MAYLPSSFLISRTSEPATGWSRRKARLRLADFFSSRWAFGAFRRRSLPVPVTLNRFFVALCVFVFGMWFHSGVLRRTQHHHHVPAVLERRGLYLPDLLHVLGQPHQQISPALRVALLPAAEHDRHLDLRALIEKAHDVALLGVVVVDPDFGSELDLLDVHRDLVLAGELGLLLLLVAVLAVIHHLRNGRIGLRGDLDEVEVLAPRVLTRLVGVLDADLRAVLIHQAHLRRADHLVDSRLRYRGAIGLHVSAWSQRRVTKLSIPPSLRQDRCKQRPVILVHPTRLNLREARACEVRVGPCLSRVTA